MSFNSEPELEFWDNLFLSSDEIIFDNNLKCFKVSLPDGNEISTSVDRLLDIF